MSDRVTQLLEDVARERTTALPVTTDPVTRVGAAVRADRHRRRAGAAIGGLAVVALAAATVVSIPRPAATPAPPAQSDPVHPQVVESVKIGGITWPRAGELLGDRSFMIATQQVLDGARPTGSAPATVLFADDVGGTRLVVARSDNDGTWVLHGPAGASPDQLEGAESSYYPESPLGPISVLVPQTGPDTDLVVLTPGTVGAEVATTPAVWPETRAPYSRVDMGQGVAVLALHPTAPFGLTFATVSVRGVGGPSAAFSGAAVSLEDPDGFVPGAAGSVDEDSLAGSAVQSATVEGGFAEEVVISAVETSPDYDAGHGTVVTGSVADVTAGGITSRALAVHVEGTEAAMRTNTSSVPATFADTDPRPLTVQLMAGKGGPRVEGTLVWAAAPGGRIEYDYRQNLNGPLDSASVRLDASGFAWLDGHIGVDATRVLAADGAVLWESDAP